MPDYVALLRRVDQEKFNEILSASGRTARDVYFRRHDIKDRAPGRFASPGATTVLRTQKLYETLQAKDDAQLAEEMLRTWLFTRRSLLAAALDHLGIANDNGVTDQDVSKFEALSSDEVLALRARLVEVAPEVDVGLYLGFMGVNGA